MSRIHQEGKLHPGIAALIVIVFLGIVTSVVIAVQNNQETPANESNSTSQSSNQPTTNTQSTDVSEYKDGTYKATGSYISPGGRESIELTVTIKDGVITGTELVQNADDRDAKQYQAAFASGYKDLVVGKNVNEVSLSRVAGSSLTSNGFNDALDQIKEDAAV